MATEYSRIIHKRTSVPGLAPTVPVSENLNDFSGTDIYEGELFYNITDQKLYTRSNSEIVLLNNSNGGGLIFDIGSWDTTSPKTFTFPEEIDPTLVVSMSITIINDDEDTWYVSGPDLWVQSFDGLSAILRARNVPGDQTRTDINRGKLKIQFGNAG